MKIEKEKIIQFRLPDFKPEIILTHGYNIKNTFPVHFHKSFTLGIIEKGSRILRIYDREYRMSEGSIFMIPPFVPHSTGSADSERDDYKVISVGYCEELNSVCFNDPVADLPELYSLIAGFHNAAEYDFSIPKCSAQFVKIVKILAEIARSTECPRKPDNSRIEAARQFIEEHCLEDLNLEQMAEQSSISPYHFNRLFHSVTGVTPYAYLILCRIAETQRVIGEKEKMSDVALDAGFYDQSHFNRAFRKHVGVNPRRYFVNEIFIKEEN